MDEMKQGGKGRDVIHEDFLLANIKTYHGRLDMLGSLDLKYKVPALAAARRTLTSYVVETKEDLALMIQRLQQRSSKWRINILCAETIMKRIREMPGLPRVKDQKGNHLPYLINLVKPKSDIAKRMFEFAFRDTLVAETFNQGHDTAFSLSKRHRVVTMEGALFEKKGSFTSGDLSKYRYMHSFLVEKAEKAVKVNEDEYRAL